MVQSTEQDSWLMPALNAPDSINSIWGSHGKTWTEKDRIDTEVVNVGRNQERYLRGSLLGSGGWSNVYKVRRVSDGEVLAGKLCRKLRLMRREAQILKSMNHERILKFVDWDEKAGVPQDTLLITELCVGGTLQQRIDNTSKGLAGHEALELLVQISSALEYLHSRGSFHSDIKPRNILIRKLQPIHIVLGDCGDMKQVGRIPKGPPRGTPAYLSPEILLHNRCQGTGDDMWALGITMLGIVGQWPQMVFTKDGAKEYPKKCFDHVLLLKRLNPGHELVEDLLAKLVHWNAASRMKAKECRRKATELRESGRWGDETVHLKMPEDFKPVSFW